MDSPGSGIAVEKIRNRGFDVRASRSDRRIGRSHTSIRFGGCSEPLESKEDRVRRRMDMLIGHLRSRRSWKKAVRCLGGSILGMLLALPIAGHAQVTRSSVAGAPIPTPSGSTNQLMQLNSSS
jgi:hypothetical protein